MNISPPPAKSSHLYHSKPAYQRFIVVGLANLAISYGSYLCLLPWLGPKIAYLFAYIIGLVTGNILHIRFTHQKSFTAVNSGIQVGIQIGVGGMATMANSWASNFLNPILSGFIVTLAFGFFSFMISRLLLR